MSTVTWRELAEQQHEAAMKGGKPWLAFVAYAEKLTGLPWSKIRDHPEMTGALQAFYREREAV